MKTSQCLAIGTGRGTTGIVLCALVLLAILTLPAYSNDEVVPPPVSGRSLSESDRIQPSDVMARVELLRANVALLRRYMGKLPPPDPLLRVEGARPREVYLQALNLRRRAQLLAFEQMRIPAAEATVIQGAARNHDVFKVLNSSLLAVLNVKRHLGIHEAVAERPQPDSTTPSEVFNATVQAGTEINQLLDSKTTPSDVFLLTTTAVHTAAAIHAALPGGPVLPHEPAYEPNKTPAEVYLKQHRCFELVREVATSLGIETLTFEVDDERVARVTPDDVSSLAVLVMVELDRLHEAYPNARRQTEAHYPGRRFSSDVFQRVGYLELILQDLVAASMSAAATSPAGG